MNDIVVPVKIAVHFPDGRTHLIKGVLDRLDLNSTRWGSGPSVAVGEPPVGSGFTLVGRISDWKEDKDGRPVGMAGGQRPVGRPEAAEAGHATTGRRARRRRAKGRASAALHGDRAG